MPSIRSTTDKPKSALDAESLEQTVSSGLELQQTQFAATSHGLFLPLQ